MAEKKTSSQTEILDAAAECFMAMGADVASIDDIARSLGATKGRIYHHYSSKGALLSAVRMRAVKFTLEAMVPVLSQNEDPTDRLRKMAFTHVLTVLETFAYHRVVLQQYRRRVAKSTTEYERELIAEIDEKREEYEDLFRNVIKNGMKSGEFKTADISVALHSVLLMLNSPIFWFTPLETNKRKNRQAIAEQLADMAVACLK